jgi:hypothetical protein
VPATAEPGAFEDDPPADDAAAAAAKKLTQRRLKRRQLTVRIRIAVAESFPPLSLEALASRVFFSSFSLCSLAPGA